MYILSERWDYELFEKNIFLCLEESKTIFSKKTWKQLILGFLSIFAYYTVYQRDRRINVRIFFVGKSLKCVFSKFKSIWSENISKSVFWAQKSNFQVFLDPKISKNRFSQKLSHTYLDIKKCRKMALEHLKSTFRTIFHHIKSYKGLRKKIIFFDSRDFDGFLRIFEKYRKSCKKGWKNIMNFFMAFLDPLITSNHCICHGNAIKSFFTKIKKN